ncbi:MAG TPA: hypothetical protein VGR07_09235 [Thermoanaerobaculia bacterium]|nr:hypothetical protein [Thermoanaerobaculia bacterium]
MDPNRPAPPKKTSPWNYIGCGCGLLVALILVSVVALTFISYRKLKEAEQSFKDPVKREARTRQILHYEQLPAGYYPMGALSFPFVMDMAILSDQEPPPGVDQKHGGGFKDHGFIYMVLRDWMGKRDELQAYMEGTGKRPDWMKKSDVDLDAQEVIGRGTVKIDGRTALYVASRGEVQSRNHRRSKGLVTLLSIDCPDDKRLRLGIWFGPDPDAGKPIGHLADRADLTGTNADPKEIQEFASHFHLCQ